MSKKQDEYFFKSFIECAEYACQAAHLLESVMDNFDPDELPRHIDEMHSLEHAADTRKHEMLDVLAKAFITPHRARGHHRTLALHRQHDPIR